MSDIAFNCFDSPDPMFKYLNVRSNSVSVYIPQHLYILFDDTIAADVLVKPVLRSVFSPFWYTLGWYMKMFPDTFCLSIRLGSICYVRWHVLSVDMFCPPTRFEPICFVCRYVFFCSRYFLSLTRSVVDALSRRYVLDWQIFPPDIFCPHSFCRYTEVYLKDVSFICSIWALLKARGWQILNSSYISLLFISNLYF
jgi:hypothetical protein